MMDPSAFTSSELGELLSLVQIQKLDTLNNCLKTMISATSGVDALVSNVRKSFPDSHRVFADPATGKVQQVLIKLTGVFLMMVVHTRMKVISISLVTKDNSNSSDSGAERTSQVAQEFVNRCAYQYWRTLF